MQEQVAFVFAFLLAIGYSYRSYRHLIADHLGWFKTTDGTSDGSLKTVEDIMRAKGETVVRGRLDAGNVVEYAE